MFAAPAASRPLPRLAASSCAQHRRPEPNRRTRSGERRRAGSPGAHEPPSAAESVARTNLRALISEFRQARSWRSLGRGSCRSLGHAGNGPSPGCSRGDVRVSNLDAPWSRSSPTGQRLPGPPSTRSSSPEPTRLEYAPPVARKTRSRHRAHRSIRPSGDPQGADRGSCRWRCCPAEQVAECPPSRSMAGRQAPLFDRASALSARPRPWAASGWRSANADAYRMSDDFVHEIERR
jgi:hypothetical protein